MALPQALVMLAGLGPIQLTSSEGKDRFEVMTQRTQAFFSDALTAFSARSVRPLILIDADTSRSVWPWLRDELIDPNNVHLAGSFHVEAPWRHASMVRVRTNNSPKVLWDKHFFGPIQDTNGDATDEIIRYHAPDAAEAALFKVRDTQGSHVYLSFGSIIRKKQVLGRSCYRKLEGMKQVKAKGSDPQYFIAETSKVHTDAWATPAAVEIVVVRAGSNQPDQVAQLVEWLRQCYAHFGEWTIKPAPLYFSTALKEYLADYDLEEDETEEDSEEE